MKFYVVGWKLRCREYFPYSTYFEGGRSSVVTGLNKVHMLPVNGSLDRQQADQNVVPLPSSDGKLENIKALKELVI